MAPPNTLLTDDDETMADWVGRWAPVTAALVAARFQRPQRSIHRRIAALRQHEVLHSTRTVRNVPTLIVPGPLHRVPAPRALLPRALRRHLAVVRHAIEAELDGHRVLCPREIGARPDLLAMLPHDASGPLMPGAIAYASPRRGVAVFGLLENDEEGGQLVQALLTHKWPAALHCRILLADGQQLPSAASARLSSVVVDSGAPPA